MQEKKLTRNRRARKTRAKIRQLEKVRMTVNRTPKHIYAQVISADGSNVIASASTLQASIKTTIAYGGNIQAATAVGEAIAKNAIEAGVNEVAFDRNGFHYHGRVKALAEAARNNGLKF